MYIAKHFSLEELVWKGIYDELHNKNMLLYLWRRFDDRFLMSIDQLRVDFGPIIINNWSLGKIAWLGNQIFSYAGARPSILPKGENWGEYTTHKDWNTGDPKIARFGKLNLDDKKIAYNDARQFIIDNPIKYPYVTVLESGDYAPTWIHLSTGNFSHEDSGIRIIKPSA